jgi:hypothetical protein
MERLSKNPRDHWWLSSYDSAGGDAQQNLDFTPVPGHALVKRGELRRSGRIFYYGDAQGSPGSLLTFFRGALAKPSVERQPDRTAAHKPDGSRSDGITLEFVA